MPIGGPGERIENKDEIVTRPAGSLKKTLEEAFNRVNLDDSKRRIIEETLMNNGHLHPEDISR